MSKAKPLEKMTKPELIKAVKQLRAREARLETRINKLQTAPADIPEAVRDEVLQLIKPRPFGDALSDAVKKLPNNAFPWEASLPNSFKEAK